MRFFDDQAKERYIPYIIETSIGCDRTLLTTLIDAYDEEEERVVLRLSPAVAPIKVAIFPLVKKDGMPDIAKKITDDLRGEYRIFYDDSGSIGRRDRRMDEAGTPFCLTVDSDTLSDGTVTIRHRDSMKQERIEQGNIKEYLYKEISLI
jgi:glycyl-tRNA synthetase